MLIDCLICLHSSSDIPQVLYVHTYTSIALWDKPGAMITLTTNDLHVLVIPQNEYGILVITRDREAEGQVLITRVSCNNKNTIRVDGV